MLRNASKLRKAHNHTCLPASIFLLGFSIEREPSQTQILSTSHNLSKVRRFDSKPFHSRWETVLTNTDKVFIKRASSLAVRIIPLVKVAITTVQLYGFFFFSKMAKWAVFGIIFLIGLFSEELRITSAEKLQLVYQWSQLKSSNSSEGKGKRRTVVLKYVHQGFYVVRIVLQHRKM